MKQLLRRQTKKLLFLTGYISHKTRTPSLSSLALCQDRRTIFYTIIRYFGLVPIFGNKNFPAIKLAMNKSQTQTDLTITFFLLRLFIGNNLDPELSCTKLSTIDTHSLQR